VVANFFFKSGKTLALAESCTGGAISSKITKISGCSSFYKGGIVSYANEIKENVLGVNKQTLQKYGAVSKQVVEEMLIGIKNLFNTDYAVAVSGIAGPLGGTSEKPVGTVWIGVMASDYQDIKEYKFGNDREINIERAALTALNRLRIALLNKE
jgi:nicotinamide-nucleotide amidase